MSSQLVSKEDKQQTEPLVSKANPLMRSNSKRGFAGIRIRVYRHVVASYISCPAERLGFLI